MVPALTLGRSWLKLYFQKNTKKKRGRKVFFLQKFSEKICAKQIKTLEITTLRKPT